MTPEKYNKLIKKLAKRAKKTGKSYFDCLKKKERKKLVKALERGHAGELEEIVKEAV